MMPNKCYHHFLPPSFALKMVTPIFFFLWILTEPDIFKQSDERISGKKWTMKDRTTHPSRERFLLQMRKLRRNTFQIKIREKICENHTHPTFLDPIADGSSEIRILRPPWWRCTNPLPWSRKRKMILMQRKLIFETSHFPTFRMIAPGRVSILVFTARNFQIHPQFFFAVRSWKMLVWKTLRLASVSTHPERANTSLAFW